jgi:hypothetical protein
VKLVLLNLHFAPATVSAAADHAKFHWVEVGVAVWTTIACPANAWMTMRLLGVWERAKPLKTVFAAAGPNPKSGFFGNGWFVSSSGSGIFYFKRRLRVRSQRSDIESRAVADPMRLVYKNENQNKKDNKKQNKKQPRPHRTHTNSRCHGSSVFYVLVKW